MIDPHTYSEVIETPFGRLRIRVTDAIPDNTILFLGPRPDPDDSDPMGTWARRSALLRVDPSWTPEDPT